MLGIAALCWGAQLVAQENGRIEGRIAEADSGRPLAGASVVIDGPELEGSVGAVSNEDGRYAVQGLPPGKYAVRASFVGYLDQQKGSVEVMAGKTATVDFRLLEAPYEMEETVVSASRQAESIIDAPATISKIDAREIERNTLATSHIGLIKNVKGVDHFQTSILQQRVNARGFNSAFNYRMLLLIDGRVTQFATLGIPLDVSVPIPKDDVQDVEVIVGPGAALYGPDASGGVINITTKDPRRAPGTRFAVSGGSREVFKGRFYHADAQGKWGWKVAGGYQRARDYEQVKTFFTPDSSLSATDDPDFDASTLRGEAGLYYYPDGESRLKMAIGGSLVNHINLSNLGRVQLEDISYQFLQLNYTSPRLFANLYRTREDTDDTFTLDTRARFRLAGFGEQEAEDAARLIGHSSLWEAEVRYRFATENWSRTRLYIGSNFRQFRADTDGTLLDDAEGGLVVSQGGVYGQSETALSERLRLVLAGRVDFHEVYETQVSPRAALIFKPHSDAALRITVNRAFQSPTLGHQSLLVVVGPSVMARGNGKGFRFGTLAGEQLPPEYEKGIPKLKPEDNLTIELGLKGVLANRLFLDLSGYRSRYKNFISPLRVINDLQKGIVILDGEGNPRKEVTLTYKNFGEQTVWGLDAEASLYFGNRLKVWSNVSFIEAGRLKAGGGIDQPFNTPGTIANLGLSATDLLVQGTELDLSLRGVSEHDFRSGVHAGTVPAYAVADLGAGYRAAYGLTYRVSANNVLGNRHREFVTGPEIGRLALFEMQYGF
jgi:iron complex outermembrane receptor protein